MKLCLNVIAWEMSVPKCFIVQPLSKNPISLLKVPFINISLSEVCNSSVFGHKHLSEVKHYDMDERQKKQEDKCKNQNWDKVNTIKALWKCERKLKCGKKFNISLVSPTKSKPRLFLYSHQIKPSFYILIVFTRPVQKSFQ